MNSAGKFEHECYDVSYFYEMVMPAVDALELETLTKLHEVTNYDLVARANELVRSVPQWQRSGP
jgi:hypothetical protein